MNGDVARLLTEAPVPLLALVCATDEPTIERWRHARGIPSQARRSIEALGVVLDALGPGLTPSDVAAWLTSPSGYLRDGRPIDSLLTAPWLVRAAPDAWRRGASEGSG